MRRRSATRTSTTGEQPGHDDGEVRSPGREPTFGRRRFLGGACLAALGGLAGCRTDVENAADASDVFGHAFPYEPKSVNLNPWPGASYPYEFYTLIFEPLSTWIPGEGLRLTDVVADFTHEGDTATVTFDDGFSWWNGESVTARDRWVYERIQSAVSDEDRPSVTPVDDTTLRYEFDAELAAPVARTHAVDGAVNTAAWLFDRWVDRFDQASTDDAHADVVDALHEWRLSLERAMEDGFGNGPYELSEVSLNRVMLDRHANHPRAAAVEIPRLWFPVLRTKSRDAFVADGKLDGGRGLLSGLDETPPSHVEELDTFQTAGGTKLVLHWDHPHLGRRAVREAMVAALPVEQVVDVGGFGDPTAVQTGLAAPARRRWLGDDPSAFRSRPVAADTDRAAELLQSADYTRDRDGTWRDAEGRTVEIRLRSPIWADWKFAAEAVDEALTSFGFEVDFTQIPNTRLVTDVRAYNFDVMLWPCDARAYRAFDVSSRLAMTVGYGVTDPDTDVSLHGKPVEVTLPSSDETVDLYEEWQRLRTAPDASAAREHVSTFARWWNATLPDIQLATGVTGVWGNTRQFDWPAAEGATYRSLGPGDRPEYRLLNRGLVGTASD